MPTESSARPRLDWRVAGGAVLIAAYFFRFAGPSLFARLAADDPMNIWGYWHRGPAALLHNLLVFYSTYTRPMGGVYYSLVYHFFGLNPLPYHAVTLALLLFNTWLAFRFAARLTGSQLTGGFCALLTAYHAGLVWLVYLPSYIYDALCFLFYFLALHVYLRARQSGEALGPGRTAVFLLLYVAALESKEMAVTLPAVVLLYDLLWRRSVTAVPFLAGAVTVVFLAGKGYGPESLTSLPAYQPTFTWERYLDSTTAFLNTLFYQPTEQGFFGPRELLGLAAALLGVAAVLRSKLWLFLVAFVAITPLPITFVPGRGGGCLYIPLVGWAILAATLLVRLVRAVPHEGGRAAVVLAAFAAQWALTARQHAAVMTWMQDEGLRTATVLAQIRSVQPRVPPGSRIYVRDDVFPGYDTKYLLELTYRDRSVEVWLDQHAHFPPAEVAKMDYVFSLEGGALRRLQGD